MPPSQSSTPYLCSSPDTSFAAAAQPRAGRPLVVGVWGGNRLLREYLGSALHSCPDVVCTLATDESPHFIDRPDVVVVEPRDMCRAMVTRLAAIAPGAKLVVLNSDAEDVNLVECVRVGALGFVLRDAGLEDVVRTVRSVAAGQRVTPRSIAARLCSQLHQEQHDDDLLIAQTSEVLTIREHQVLPLIAEGLTNKEIADRLSIATHTVKSHVHNLLTKLKLRKRVELVSHFLREHGRPVEPASS